MLAGDVPVLGGVVLVSAGVLLAAAGTLLLLTLVIFSILFDDLLQ